MSPKPTNSLGILPERQARTPAPPNGAATPAADRVNTPVPLLRANGTAPQTVVDRPSTPATSTRLAIDRHVQVPMLLYQLLIACVAFHGQRK